MARTTGTAESPGRAKSQTLTAREVAVEILRRKGGGPMKVTELAKLVVKSPKTNLGGKTPEATVAAHIYTAAKTGVLFKKTGRGEVQLLPDVGQKSASAAKEKVGAAAKVRKTSSKEASGVAAAGNGASAGSTSQKKGPQASDDVTAGDRRARGETPAPDAPTPEGDDAGDGDEDEAPESADRELAGAAR